MANITTIVKSLTNGVRVYGDDDHPLFVAADVGKWLGLTNIHTSLSSFSTNEKSKTTIIDTIGRKHLITALTVCGLYKMVSISRSPVAEDLRQRMNYEFGYYQSILEPAFINKIKTIFSTEEFETQKQVLDYHIDLYMPKYNLTIEFDEAHHRWQQESDRIREAQITEQIGCTFIRVKETDDICVAAGHIYSHIHRIC